MASSSQPAGSPLNENTVFSIRIVSNDYYMTSPITYYGICYSFHGGTVEKVPVIRIYGSTLAGQKTCLHVHRVTGVYMTCFLPLKRHLVARAFWDLKRNMCMDAALSEPRGYMVTILPRSCL